MTHLPQHLQTILESLCLDGCKNVRLHIHAIEHGQLPLQLQALSNAERQQILDELKTIMAVYDRCES